MRRERDYIPCTRTQSCSTRNWVKFKSRSLGTRSRHHAFTHAHARSEPAPHSEPGLARSRSRNPPDQLCFSIPTLLASLSSDVQCVLRSAQTGWRSVALRLLFHQAGHVFEWEINQCTIFSVCIGMAPFIHILLCFMTKDVVFCSWYVNYEARAGLVLKVEKLSPIPIVYYFKCDCWNITFQASQNFICSSILGPHHMFSLLQTWCVIASGIHHICFVRGPWGYLCAMCKCKAGSIIGQGSKPT